MTVTVDMASREPDIADDDRRPIAIIQIDEVEYCLQTGSGSAFMENVRRIAAGDNLGWMLSSVHKPDGEEREYPFKRDLGELIPWWTDPQAAVV